jgi:hypothetical protein
MAHNWLDCPWGAAFEYLIMEPFSYNVRYAEGYALDDVTFPRIGFRLNPGEQGVGYKE